MTTTPDYSGWSSQDLIQHLRRRGVSARDIAAALDRNSSIVYQIAAGKKSGASYQQSLAEIAQLGHAIHRPARRRRGDGSTANVRGRRGQAGHAPPPPTPAPVRGKFGVSPPVVLPDGGRIYELTVPKSGPNRERGNAELLRILRSAAKGHRQVSWVATMADGRQVEVGAKGGYRSSDALARARGEGDDPLAWIGDEAQAIYAEAEGPVVKVTTQVWGTQTSAAERRRYLS